MPSTAAWSAAILSPRPTQRAACSAAASVTRTSSSARLRSGESPVAAVGAPARRSSVTGRRAACGGARTDGRGSRRPRRSRARRAKARYQPRPRPIWPLGLARALDDAVPEDEGDGGEADDGGQLAARPRQLVPAHDDVEQDDRRERRQQQQHAADRVRVPDRGVDAVRRPRSRSGCPTACRRAGRRRSRARCPPTAARSRRAQLLEVHCARDPISLDRRTRRRQPVPDEAVLAAAGRQAD